jgi:NAD+ kinase
VTTGGRLERIGAVVHPGRAGASTLGKELARWASVHGIALRGLETECGHLGIETECRPVEEFAPGLDLIVALGGDGTLLRAAGLGLAAEVPVLGVNLGRLGFLTEVEADDLPAALDEVLAGRYSVERRTTLDVVATVADEPPTTASAVNDVVLEKTARHHLAGIAVRIDGRLFARYAADGLIVATPTGSTAYSFSAGGPILSPRLDALMLTPIAPHMVFNRSLVLHPDQVIRLEVLPGSSGVDLNVDGAPTRQLPPGSVVEARRGVHEARLVRLDHTDFFGRVRSKFQLADAGVAGPEPG